MKKYNTSSTLDVCGLQSRTSNVCAPLGEYFSRVGEVRSIQRELRTLQAHQGTPHSEDADMSGYSIASHLREAAGRLVQKEKERDTLKERCLEMGVYQDPSSSDSDYIDSLSELGPGHMANAPSVASRSHISTAVPSLREDYPYSESHVCNNPYTRQGARPVQMEANHVDADSWPHPVGKSHQIHPSYTGYHNWFGAGDQARQTLDSDSECEQERFSLPPYRHKKLPPAGTPIRLVRLKPAMRSSREIDCEIVIRDLGTERQIKNNDFGTSVVG